MKMKIRIRASVIDLTVAERYRASAVNGRFTADSGEEYDVGQIEEVCTESVESAVTGDYTVENGRAVLSYEETQELGFSAVTELIFRESERGVLTLLRTGEVCSVFRFDLSERRQRCSYETPLAPLEFTVNTRGLSNTVSETGGTIRLDYSLEIQGVNTERNRLEIEVRPI